MKLQPKQKLKSGNKYKLLKKHNSNHLFKYSLKSWILLLALLAFLLTANSVSSTLLLCVVTTALVTVGITYLDSQNALVEKSLTFLRPLIITLVITGFCWVHLAEPAQAQFFRKAEDFFRYNLTQGLAGSSGTVAAVSLVFNVLRAIYLLYIAISLIGVVNSIRKDEDWQTVIRTPLLVVVAVTIADVLTGFVVGNT